MDYYYQVMPIGQINDSLTYKYSHSIEVGSIVEIPLRKRKSAGVIISQTNIKDLKFDLKKYFQLVIIINLLFVQKTLIFTSMCQYTAS